MARFSIIVPCYNVQAYLGPCLDSILGQSFGDFDLIAVDDASPDHCGMVLDEYAARDPRVHVLHLEENVGLGRARNAGIERATGDYLLFVDSDDWLAADALAKIAVRLEETEPDVLYFDHARAFRNGDIVKNRRSHLFRQPPPPPTFELAERLSAMDLFMVAWNKAYRNGFMREIGVTFPAGSYEDIPVNYPVLMMAERIGLLPEVCYFYRQRDTGSILRTTGRHHFEIFDAYDSVFAFMDAHREATDRYRHAMFRKMILHEVTLLRQEIRLEPGDQRAYFDRLSEQYARWLPEGFTPEGPDAWKLRMVERGAFGRYMRKVRRRALRASLKQTRKQVPVRATATKRWAAARARQGSYGIQRRLPIRKDLAVFAVDRYRAPGTNPLAVYRALRSLAPDIDAVWIVRHSDRALVPPGMRAVIDGSTAYLKAIARARFFVNNVNFPDVVRKRRGQVHVMTQHGTPLATMGIDLHRYPTAARDLDFDQIIRRADRWDYNVSASRYSTEIWQRVYPCNYQMLETGNPRTDRYYRADGEEVAAVRASLGIETGTVAVLFAPTGRGYGDPTRRTVVARIARSLPGGHRLIMRTGSVADPALLQLAEEGRFQALSRATATEDMGLAADVLVTDYSSIMFDYANLNRPIVIFADDYETYRRVRGTYFDLLAEAPGAVATTEEELIEILTSGSYASVEASQKLDAFRRRFCEWDDGYAAERVVRAVFLGEEPAPPLPFAQRTPAPAPG